MLFVPLVSGGRSLGLISHPEPGPRRTPSARRTCGSSTTLAGSLSVALENARLFDETKRLLAESNERAAELAIINSVQQGLAAELDMQAMYDLVGDKLVEIFDAQVVDIGLYDVARRHRPLPVHDRAGRAGCADGAMPIGPDRSDDATARALRC